MPSASWIRPVPRCAKTYYKAPAGHLGSITHDAHGAVQEHTVLSLPRQGGAAEQVVSLQWSPAKQRSLLLAVTASGRCLVWSQPCPGAESDALVTIGDWHSEEACRTAAAPGFQAACVRMSHKNALHLGG